MITGARAARAARKQASTDSMLLTQMAGTAYPPSMAFARISFILYSIAVSFLCAKTAHSLGKAVQSVGISQVFFISSLAMRQISSTMPELS